MTTYVACWNDYGLENTEAPTPEEAAALFAGEWEDHTDERPASVEVGLKECHTPEEYAGDHAYSILNRVSERIYDEFGEEFVPEAARNLDCHEHEAELNAILTPIIAKFLEDKLGPTLGGTYLVVNIKSVPLPAELSHG